MPCESPEVGNSQPIPVPADVGFIDGFREGIEIHPAAVYATAFGQRLRNIVKASREDVTESPNKVKTVGLGIATIGTQVLDRARISVVFVPKVATEVLNHTNEAAIVGLAAGATYALWNGSVGEVLNNGIDEYPEAKESFTENFPAVVEVFSESLPGLSDDTEDASKQTFMKQFFKKIGLHARRAGTGIGIGSTAFVATAHAKGLSKKEARKINLGVTLDTGLLVGGIAGVTVEAINRLAESGRYELANDIKNVVTDMRVWYGVAVFSMVSEYLGNRRKKRDLIKEDDFTQQATEQS